MTNSTNAPQACGFPIPALVSVSIAQEPQGMLLLEDIINNDIPSPEYVMENIWRDNQFVYEQLRDQNFATLTLDLQDFCTQITETPQDDISNIETEIIEMEYQELLTKINAIEPTNVIEENYKQVYEILVNHMLLDTVPYTPDELFILNTIANKCMFSDGDAVLMAQSIIESEMQQRIDFDCNCISSTISRLSSNDKIDAKHYVRGKRNAINPEITKNNLLLLPNPSKGILTVSGYVNETSTLSIYNSIGELVLCSKNLKSGDAIQLNKGLYYYGFSSSNKTLKYEKLVIE